MVGYTCLAYSAIQSGKDINILLYVSSSACVGRDSSVGTATPYGLGGPEIESRRGRDFPHPSKLFLGPTQPTVQWVPGFSRDKGRWERDADYSPPSSAVFKKG